MSENPVDSGVRTVPALVQRLAHSGTERMRADFAARGMPTLRPVHALLLVPLLGGGRHASRLAEDLGVTRQAVAQVVTTLERDGYVRRVTDPGDARAKLICLTPRGRSALRAMHASARATEEDWRRKLGAERLAEFRATLLALLSGEDHPSAHVLKGRFQVAVDPSPPAASSRAAATRTGGPACASDRLSWSSG